MLASVPSLAVDAAGNALALFAIDVSGLKQVFASRFNSLTGQWDAADQARNISSGEALSRDSQNQPALSINRSGEVLAGWCDSLNGSVDCMRLTTRRFD